jgi:ribosomal protein S18 acetylase RimI-like enzyme
MLCEFARKEEASDVKLLVFKDKKPALNLYGKLGFYQTHIPQIDKELREEAKKTGRQRIIMKRNLARGSGPI